MNKLRIEGNLEVALESAAKSCRAAAITKSASEWPKRFCRRPRRVIQICGSWSLSAERRCGRQTAGRPDGGSAFGLASETQPNFRL